MTSPSKKKLLPQEETTLTLKSPTIIKLSKLTSEMLLKPEKKLKNTLISLLKKLTDVMLNKKLMMLPPEEETTKETFLQNLEITSTKELVSPKNSS